MKKEIDWGTWLSMAAVAVVCGVIALTVAPSSKDDGEDEPKKDDVAEKEAATAADDGGLSEADAVEADDADAPGKSKDKKDKKDKEGKAEPDSRGTGYRPNMPDQTFELSKELNEISGLSASKEPDSLWAIHDERPTLFRLSTKDGKVVQEVDLGHRGDYESVEEVGDFVYVGRSDGEVLVVDPTGKTQTTTLNFTTRLGLACDMEGIAFEAKKNRMLLSCKNEGSKSKKTNKAFEIYEMSMVTKEMKKEPAFVLNEDAIDAYIAAHADQPELKDSHGRTFAPSGLAVHPKTGEIYIVSTRGKMLVVMAADGTLVRVDALDPAVHRQPEGIAFTADGTLFISNEAHGKMATLHVYKANAASASKE